MSNLSAVETRLSELGLTVPAPPSPAANYVPWVRTGNLVFVAGQVPMRDGAFRWVGRLGEHFDVDQGVLAAREVALNVLSQLRVACGGDLDRVERVVKLNGFVACTADFGKQPHVINGASELMICAFGEAGRHARAAVGVVALPFGVAVEIDGVFQVRADD